MRIERIADGPFECVSCGAQTEVAPFADLLELMHRYTEIVLKLEERVTVEGDTAVPLPKQPTKTRVTW